MHANVRQENSRRWIVNGFKLYLKHLKLK